MYSLALDENIYNINDGLVELLNNLISESGNSKIALRYVSPSALIRQYKELRPCLETGKIYYFCASFQSGSPKILELMNRPKNIDKFISLIAKIDREYPKVYKHTQVIVGFPQETEEDFQMSLDMLRKANFDYITVIKYSGRPYTNSILMNGQIDEDVVERRFQEASVLVSKLRKEKFKNLIYAELLNGLD